MAAHLLTSWSSVMTWGGGFLALRLQAYRAFVLAFAAGALVASALIDLIPDALELLTKSGGSLHHHHLLFACCLGFLAFYLLEQGTHDQLMARAGRYAWLWQVQARGDLKRIARQLPVRATRIASPLRAA